MHEVSALPLVMLCMTALSHSHRFIINPLICIHRCDDLPPIQSSAQRFHRVVMIIPPVRNSDGSTSAAKNVNALLLPLLQDLQRVGPAYTGPDVSHFDGILGSVPSSNTGITNG